MQVTPDSQKSKLSGDTALIRSRKRIRFMTLGIFTLVIIGFGCFLIETWRHQHRQELEEKLNELAEHQADALEIQIYAVLGATEAMDAAVQFAGGVTGNFDRYARDILANYRAVSSFQLAEKGIVTHIYPLEGNEQALGHNILTDETRRLDVLDAIRRKQSSLAVIQGGHDLIASNPVFIDNNGTDVFWGFASAQLRLETLIEQTGSDDIQERGLNLSVGFFDPYTLQQTYFWGDEPASGLLQGTALVTLPNTVWSVFVQDPHWQEFDYRLYGYVILGISTIFLVVIANRILLQPEILQQTVNQQTRSLRQLAYQDPVTGIFSRLYFLTELERICSSSDVGEMSYGLLLIDLDDFKSVNDSYGHNIGDKFLRVIAQRLQQQLISKFQGFVARLGGDEFAILLELPRKASKDPFVDSFARQVLASISQPLKILDYDLRTTGSIGIVQTPWQSIDPLQLLSFADMAMYAAKRDGRNQFRVFDAQLDQIVRERNSLINDLRFAIENQQLFCHWQPVVDLSNGDVVACEVLLRWQHPEKGFISPDIFIPLAEETGLILPLGYQVLENACAQLAARHLDNISLAINLSPRQFLDVGLQERFTEIVRNAGIEPTRIKIEVTESVVMANPQSAISVLKSMQKLGFEVALDDFGTGYSSLSMLKNLPVNYVKIDKSFIVDIVRDNRDKDIVKSTIDMAQALNIKVIAEGIETAEQLLLLREKGCEYGQGFLFARPQLPEACTQKNYPVT